MARKTGVSTPYLAALWHCSLMVAIATLYNETEWEAAVLGSFVAATALAGVAMQPLWVHLVVVLAGAASAASASRSVAMACSVAGVGACSVELGVRAYRWRFD